MIEDILPHLAEFIEASNWPGLTRLKSRMDITDIIAECYVRAMTGQSEDAKQLREFYTLPDPPDAQRRQRIVIVVMSTVKNLNKKEATRRRIEMKNGEEIVRMTMSSGPGSVEADLSNLQDLFQRLGLSNMESSLLLWKLDIMSDAETTKLLRCSRATLYNRLNILKEKIRGKL